MKYRIVLTFYFVTFLALASFAQKKNSASLFGNWESESMHDSHLTIIKINPDSTFSFQKDLAENYYIKIKGKKLIRSFLNKDSVKVAMDTSYFKLKKDSLIITIPQKGEDKIIAMVRLKRHPGKSIIGSYTWKYPNGRIAFSKFTKDGKWLFRLPDQILKGKFDIYNDNITFHFSGKAVEYIKRMFYVKGNRLLLRDTRTGVKEYYRRVDYFPEG